MPCNVGAFLYGNKSELERVLSIHLFHGRKDWKGMRGDIIALRPFTPPQPTTMFKSLMSKISTFPIFGRDAPCKGGRGQEEERERSQEVPSAGSKAQGQGFFAGLCSFGQNPYLTWMYGDRAHPSKDEFGYEINSYTDYLKRIKAIDEWKKAQNYQERQDSFLDSEAEEDSRPNYDPRLSFSLALLQEPPNHALLLSKFPPWLHPLLEQRPKKDARIWLWKGERGQAARQYLERNKAKYLSGRDKRKRHLVGL